MSEDLNFFTDGAAYERLMGRWTVRVGEVFLDWLAPPKGLRWLDVGCGNGAFTELLIARAAPAGVEGIDPSESQIAYACTRPGARLARFQQGDAQALPFGDGAFDAAVMALVIIFVPDPVKALSEMARVVRPGGSVAAYMWDTLGGGTPIEPVRAGLAAMGIEVPPPPGSGSASLEGMRALWNGAGLVGIETRTIEIEVSYRDFEDFWQSNTALPNPVTKRIQTMSRDEVERLKRLLRERLPGDAAGRIAYSARANAVKGRVPE
jgi:ubiquinone/menaquinone biosynthesis C-methylase UbiE